MNKETPKRTPLSAAYRNSAAVLPWMLCAATLMAAGPAQAGGALPTNGQYVAGQGSITSAAGNVTVNQSTSHGIINWQNFSIGQGNSVLFNNGSGATLNRVTGGQISQIDGSLKATGSVYLINPQGIVIGPSGQVIANGSFVASTRDVSNSAFMSGQPFSASGTSNGNVINQGVITSNTGDAILVGSSVTNTGSISAPNGTVGLAAGNEITLQPAGTDSRIAISGGTGSVTNSGTLKAAQAELNAAGGNVYTLVENNGGTISATGTTNVGGHVWLTAGGRGTVAIAGTINAQNADGSGGDVTVRGANIKLPGTVYAFATTASGNGGDVSVIASNNASVSGAIHAGGGTYGQGGSIETSGHTLSFGGANIDAGKGGNWLLDPYDLTVTSSAATTIDNSLNAGTSVTLQTTATGTSGPGTANSSGSGNINIDAPLSWNTSATLTLEAYASIVLAANVTVQAGGGVVLVTNMGGAGGDYSFQPGDSLSFTGGSSAGASLSINGNAYTLLYAMGDVQNVNNNLGGHYALATSLNAATDPTTPVSWTPIGTDGQGNVFSGPNGFGFLGTFAGLGNTISNLTVDIGSNDYAGLFGYSQGTIRDVGVIGGSVTGGYYVGGLVGENARSVQNSYATATVSGATDVGGLVGENDNTIVGSYATGAVTTTATNGDTGGLVGLNRGTITQSYATGAATGESFGTVGGLVGANSNGRIKESYATGAVVGGGYAILVGMGASGGLVGNNTFGSITDSYATGHVTYLGGPSFEGPLSGGLVGTNFDGTIVDSFWDTQTTGQSVGIGIDNNSQSGNVTGLTTAQLQGALPGAFSSSDWSTGAGFYPYLTSLFPHGIAAVSGTAYSDAGTTLLVGATVGVDVNGSLFTTASTGANGYYYAFGQPIASGAGVLAYTSASAGGTNAATYVQGTASASGLTGVNIDGNTFNATTSAANYSTLANAAAGNDVNGQAAINGTPNQDITATGGSFTLDQALNIAGNFALTATAPNSAITVLAPVTASTLGLTATSNIAFDADVTVTGGGASSFTTGGAGYSFGTGGSIDFTGGDGSGATLTINGQPFTLVYTAADLQAINNNLNADYALADSIDASSTSNWTPLGTNGHGAVLNGNAGFKGAFAGLGNMLSNMTVNIGSSSYAGVFGVSFGTIRDVNVENADVTGGTSVGALIGENLGSVQNASVENSAITGSGYGTGGLVGFNALGGGIGTSKVSDTTVDGAGGTGGFVGLNAGALGYDSVAGSTIVNSAYGTGGFAGQNAATGNIENSSVASSVVGGQNYVGGFVGNNAGTIGNSSASTTTSGTAYAITGVGYVGGFAGENVAGATISGSSSANTGTNAVYGSGNRIGGFVGWNAGTLSSDQTSDAVSGAAQVGGFVGWNDGGVSGSAVLNASVTGTQFGTGGFVGYNTATGNIASSTVASITVSGAGGVGGFAGLNGGTLSSDGVSGTTIDDSASGTGGFVGQNAAGATITNSAVEGALTTATSTTVNGAATTGGFVGANYGSISSSGVAATATSGTFSVGGASYVGGFAGINETGGTVSGSSVGAAGTTTGTGSRVGGFVGWNAVSPTGVIGLTDDRAADAVLGAQQVGGLVGWNDGSISEASSSGSVAGTSSVGGFAGYNTATGTIDQSYAIGSVTGTSYLGGLVGDNLGTITNAYATGAVGETSASDVGGLVGANFGTINDVYAAAIVAGQSGSTGALVGYNASAGSIGNAIPGSSTAYYDAGVTGSLAAIGNNVGRADIVALGGAGEEGPTQAASYANFDFTDVWTIAPGELPTLMHAP